jgi:hypothetical protein
LLASGPGLGVKNGINEQRRLKIENIIHLMMDYDGFFKRRWFKKLEIV